MVLKEFETFLMMDPVCPHCGYACSGSDGDADGDIIGMVCDCCGEEFWVSVGETIYYSSYVNRENL